MIYFDLDSVVTGPLDALAAYRGPFATLATDGMENERRDGGFNSSVMLWDGRCTAPGSTDGDGDGGGGGGMALRCGRIHSLLVSHFKTISQVIYKFDHWLEMVVGGDRAGQQDDATGGSADVLQQLLPGVIAEYKQSCVDGVGADVSFVTFPLQPKPHNCESEWVRRLWTLDGDYDVDDGTAADDDTTKTADA